MQLITLTIEECVQNKGDQTLHLPYTGVQCLGGGAMYSTEYQHIRAHPEPIK